MPSKPVARAAFAVAFAQICLLFSAAAKSETVQFNVIYAAPDRAYVDGGAANGVAVGDRGTATHPNGAEVQVAVIELADRSAAVHAVGPGSLRAGDRVLLRCSGRPPVTPAGRRKTPGPAAMNSDALAALWKAAHASNPPTQIRYRSTDTGGTVSVNGRVGTEYQLYTYFTDNSLLGSTQDVSFRTRADNLGTEGLSVRFRGKVLARYDDNADLYMTGRKAIPLIREAAAEYHPSDRPFFGTFGRFAPRMSQIALVDGIEAGAALDRLTISFFGGLRPSDKDLVPSLYRQTFGGKVSVRPLPKGARRLESAVGAAAEITDGSFSRAAVTLDNRFSDAALFLSQVAAFEFLGVDNRGDPISDFAVSLLGLNLDYRLDDRRKIDFRARYDEQTLFVEDVEDLSAQWIDALRGRRHGRAEVGLSLLSRKNNRWRPFLFGRGNFDEGIDTGYAGAGFQLSNDAVFGSRSRLFATFDVAFGTGQVADFNLTLDTPFTDALHLTSGLYNAWHRTQDASVNTLSHLLFFMLHGRVVDRLELFANLSAAYDHALVRLTYPFGGRFQLQAGATYWW